MRIEDLLRHPGLPTVEIEVLAAALFARERTWVLAHPETQLSQAQVEQWTTWMERRERGEPTAYIVGEREFYGRSFSVDRRVLIPRPATEGLIDIARAWLKKPTDSVTTIDAGIVAMAKTLHEGKSVRTVLDIGTGSGCIAITMACVDATLSVIATDLSEDALSVARHNARRHDVESTVTFALGPLLEPIANLREPFLLLSNPPYVPSHRSLPKDVAQFEPTMAIRAGDDGLDVLRPLLLAALEHPACQGFVIECEETQVAPIQHLLIS